MLAVTVPPATHILIICTRVPRNLGGEDSPRYMGAIWASKPDGENDQTDGHTND